MDKISHLFDTLLVYATTLTRPSISGLPRRLTQAEARPARWRLRLAHP